MLIAGGIVPGARSEGMRSDATATHRPTNQAEYDLMFKQVSNWGRWGAKDELGTANLVTDAKRKQAVSLIRNGISVSLAHDLVTEKAADNPNPFEVSNGGNAYRTVFHGTVHSHMDALCHLAYKGQMYNGYSAAEINSPQGCTRMGIQLLKNGLTTRGILIDIPRLKGVEYLEPGTPVYPEDIEAWEKKAGVKVSAGDAILLRTGRWVRRTKVGPWQLYPPPPGEPGYHASVVPWVKSRDVAFVGADVSNDVAPSLVEGVPLPFHTAVIVSLGAYIFDALDLDALAETAARLNRWEFMLTGAPMAVAGGTGSPITLIAIF
jgi:kynurenine formamidase